MVNGFQAVAIDGLSIGVEYGVSNTIPIKLSGQWIWPSELMTHLSWPLNGYWDVSCYHIMGIANISYT